MPIEIKIDNLVFGYHQTKSFNYPINTTISNPGIYAILGQNGTGKSTFIKTLLNIIKPLSGKILYDNLPLEKNKCIKISYIPQFHSVNSFFHIPVKEFILQGLGPKPKAKILSAAFTDLLAEWQLDHVSEKSFYELSSGQKVRSMIARAFISVPEVLFLDEPLANLDSCCQQQLMDTLQDLSERHGMIILMIDHHFEKFSDAITKKIIFDREHDKEKAHVKIL